MARRAPHRDAEQRLSWRRALRAQVYDALGQPASFRGMVDLMMQHDVVLLGEFHDDPVAHRLEFEVLRMLDARCRAPAPRQQPGAAAPGAPPGASSAASTSGSSSGASSVLELGPPPAPLRRLVLSLEMFETDVQPVVDEYLAGAIRDADLLKDARAWPNYRPDYEPLVLFARDRWVEGGSGARPAGLPAHAAPPGPPCIQVQRGAQLGASAQARCCAPAAGPPSMPGHTPGSRGRRGRRRPAARRRCSPPAGSCRWCAPTRRGAW
jgi:hypothetical protein